MVIILLPAYNESEALPALMKNIGAKLADIPYRVIAVDDGSTDDTLETLEQLSMDHPVETVVHQQNLGLGAALKSGVARFLEIAGPDDILVIMDADNTCPAEIVKSMIEKIEQGADMVQASRWVEGAQIVGVPLMRRFFSRAAGLILKIFLPVEGMTDYTSGYRAYTVGILRTVQETLGEKIITRTGFSGGIELMLNANKAGAKFAETPFVLRYDLKAGASKMRVVKYIFEIFSLILRYKLR
jgi:dolichol-phosphate mannosyltransferase